MNTTLKLVLRVVLGIFLMVFGLNKFLHFLPMGEMGEAAGAYFGALVSSKTLILVAIVEVVAGLSLLVDKYAALMLLILMSVSINAVLFHITLAPEGVMPALVLLILNVVLLYAYRGRYQELLKA